MATAAPLVGISVVPGTAGVQGQNTSNGVGVLGESNAGRGVYGRSASNYGVSGDSTSFPGVRGTSVSGRGVEGWSTRDDGVFGISTEAVDVHGVTEGRGRAVVGESRDGVGVHGLSQTNEGMHGETNGPNAAAMGVIHHAEDSGNAALFASKKGDRNHAGFFEGHVHVTRDLSVDGEIWANAGDCAEDFDIAVPSRSEPGTVMLVGAGRRLASERIGLRPVRRRCRLGGRLVRVGDRSGQAEGSARPASDRLDGQGVLQGRRDVGAGPGGRPPRQCRLAGHAMKATDTAAAFGAVIGKALQSLAHGRGLLPILVTLQ